MMIHGSRSGEGGVVGGSVGASAAKGIEEELSLPILVSERVRKAVGEADSFKSECVELGRQVDILADMLRIAVRRVAASPSPYERPVRRIAAETTKSLERALGLARRCRRSGVLSRVVTMTTGSADFRKVLSVLEASVGDLRWLLNVYSFDDLDGDGGGGGSGGVVITLPPIASTDPILSYVWSCVATVQMGKEALDRSDAATSLANLALDNDRNKNIIVEEGGVPPLLSLLKDGNSVDAQIAAAVALSNLANDGGERVTALLSGHAVPIIIKVLTDAPMRLQAHVAVLVAKMASRAPVAQEEFARENAIRPLVSLLSFEVLLDDPKLAPKKPTSIHSIVQINRHMASSNSKPSPRSPLSQSSGGSSSSSSSSSNGGGSGGFSRGDRNHHQNHRKERENELPEVKLQLKVDCAKALWMLSRECISNSRKITETKGLLCLSKLIEREKGELQFNCLMTVMEIAAAAESDADLRRSAFKTNSPAAKAVVDQLLRVAQQGSSPNLQVPAIRAIGSLSRTFPAREARVLSPVVAQLGHWKPDVVTEAIVALGKFASPDNFLCVEHSKAIMDFGAAMPVLRLLRSGEKTQYPALILLCFLSLHVPSHESLEQAKVLMALESVYRSPLLQENYIKELLPKAIYQLELYRPGGHVRHRHAADAM